MIRQGFRLPHSASPVPLEWMRSPLALPAMQRALGASLVVHVMLIVFFTFQGWLSEPPVMPDMEVVLVNSKSDEKPQDATRIAQTNLNGGGNTDEDRVLKSPLSAEDDELAQQASAAEQQVARLEREVQSMLARVDAEREINRTTSRTASGTPSPEQASAAGANGQANPADPARGLLPGADGAAFSRQAAIIAREMDAYQKRPRRKEIGGRTQAAVYARYEEDYRSRVERMGTLHYPQPRNGQPVYGRVRLTVSILPSGQIERIVMNSSSGDPYLDQQATNIVNMSAPFGKFPADMAKEIDVLDITRTFTFTRLADGMHAD